MKIGKVEISQPSIEDLLQILKQKEYEGFELVYLFADNIIPSVQEWIKGQGLKLFDEKITFEKKISDQTLITNWEIEIYSEGLNDQLRDLAIQSGHKSRFYKDLKTRSYFEGLYTLWIQKSVDRQLADDVLVFKKNCEIVGFVTVKKDGEDGTIGLIAVDHKVRGLGIGKQLMIAAENWFLSKECKTVQVVTQADNLGACKLYSNRKFVRKSFQLIFHL